MAFVEAARSTLELALYDVRLPGPIGDEVAGAIKAAAARGVAVRLVYNEDDDGDRVPVPPPPATKPDLLHALGVPVRGIPGMRDLMHHKYVVSDNQAVWTGSMNWTLDSWTRQENVIAIVDNAGIAQAFRHNFEELWRRGEVEGTGETDPPRGDIRAWFCPGRGEALSLRIAAAIKHARKRIRIASPVITSAPIVATLAEVASDRRCDVAGVIDGTQMERVFVQWHANGNAEWKLPLIHAVLSRAPFAGKPTTPWEPDSVHDFMHAKVTVADDTVFLGSFNLSHSGEQNAENVLEIRDPQIADRMATFIDSIRARYPQAPLPALNGVRGTPAPRRP